MPVTFQDYYQTLGLPRTASAEEIRRAFRKLARQYHPDVNKGPDAEKKFQAINEAHEVLSDPDKRRRYDQLGEHWKEGQEFRPPPGFENFHFNFAPGSSSGFRFKPGGQFSDFFEQFFRSAQARRPHEHEDHEESEHELTITLEEACHGGSRTLELQGPEGRRTLEVKIPRGAADGTRMRLASHGVILRLRIAPHPLYEVDGRDLITQVRITPWQAALGGKVSVPTLEGEVALTVPPGSSSGAKLRLRGKGMPNPKGEAGDLFAQLKIVVPRTLTRAQQKLYEQLREAE